LGKAIYKYVLKSKEPDLTKKLHFYSFWNKVSLNYFLIFLFLDGTIRFCNIN
jgi:hypothetical protein